MERMVMAYGNRLGWLARGVACIYDKTHWFTDKEAWAIYRLFAITEAVGWTLLIGAIVYRSFDLPGSAIAVSLAGRIHGMFFVLYFLFTLLTARSMGWNFWKVAGALAAGVAPYTSVIYERCIAYLRRKHPVRIQPPAGADI